MTPDILYTNIERHIHLTQDDKVRFLSVLRTKTVKKKSIILSENKVSTHATFVLKGCLKAYTVNDNGFEHIIQFAPEDWWVTDMYSFISQKPGNIIIEAIENSEVVQLSRADQLRLFDDIPAFERYFRIITEKSLVSYRTRLMDNMSLTATERYAGFCEQYPTLITKLPQKLIASYIGVTPEFLSKMRARLRNKTI